MLRYRITGAKVAGAVVAMLGMLVAVCWVVPIRAIDSLVPGFDRLNLISAMLFVAIGVYLFAATPRQATKGFMAWVTGLCIAVLIALPLGYLVESIADISLGLDFVRDGASPTSDRPHPGRISPNASLGYLLTGVAFWLMRRPWTPLVARVHLGLVASIALIGLAGLAGHLIGLEGLYKIASYNQMLPPTAVVLSVVAAGMWLLHQEFRAALEQIGHVEEGRIKRISWAVITLVTLSGGVAGFGVMRDTFERSISENMLLTATTTASSLTHTIDTSLWFPRTVATRPTVTETLTKLNNAPADPQARDFLQKVAESFLTAGLSGVEFFSASGQSEARAGVLVRSAGHTLQRLQNAGQTAVLLWDNGYLLASENEVKVGSRTVGRVVTEQRLPLFDTLLSDVRRLNATADAAICSRKDNMAVCAPTRVRQGWIELPMTDAAGGTGLPITRAILGEQGVLFTTDQRGVDVLTVFAPIGPYGLGFAVKTDTETLYAPLKSRVNDLALALVAIIVAGIYAQRTQVRPLIRQLVKSEERLKSILEDQTELVSLASADGELTYVNPAYARHFGRTPEQMVGTNLFDFVEVGDRPAVKALVAELIRNETTITSENRMVSANGVELWVAWTNRIQHDEATGQPILHSVGRDVTGRRRAEDALRTSQAFLARTERVAGVGGWELHLASGALTWSEETRRIHEVGDHFEPTLETAVEFYLPEARPVIENAIKRAIDVGTPWDVELGLVTARGRSIWVRAQGEAEFENGTPVRLVGAFQDITERKHLERRLADSERFVRQVTDSLPVRIAYIDKETRYRFVNLAHCSRFGLPREKILGRTRAELGRAAMGSEAETRIQAVLGGQEQRYEFEEVVDGKTIVIDSRQIPDVNDLGEVLGFYSTGVDITERVAIERAQRDLTEIFDNTPDYVVQADWRGNIHYLNPAVREALHLGLKDSTRGLNFATFNTAETNDLFAREIVPAVKARGVWIGEATVLVAENRVVPVNHMVIAHRDHTGRVARYSAVMRDISDEMRARQDLALQTATLRSVAEAIPAIVAVVGVDCRYRFVNTAFERWVGARRGSIVGQTLEQILGPDDYERSLPWVKRVLAGESVSFERSYVNRSTAKHLSISYIPLWNDREVEGFVGVAQDISLHKQEEGRLLQLAQRDALTGLLNRAGFEEFLETRLRDGGESAGKTIAILYIDLDHFKPVNDTHGHPVGDQLLQSFAQRLEGVVRPNDAVARLGGDEFAIALAGIRQIVDARGVGTKVLSAAKAPFEVGGLTLSVGASVGMAYGVESGAGWRDLVKRADAMLYRAKAAGRGTLVGEE